MKQNRRKFSGVFLLLAMAFLTLGLSTDNKAFTWVAIAFIVISLVAGGRWLRPRRK
jgi:hypothetical protein